MRAVFTSKPLTWRQNLLPSNSSAYGVLSLPWCTKISESFFHVSRSFTRTGEFTPPAKKASLFLWFENKKQQNEFYLIYWKKKSLLWWSFIYRLIRLCFPFSSPCLLLHRRNKIPLIQKCNECLRNYPLIGFSYTIRYNNQNLFPLSGVDCRNKTKSIVFCQKVTLTEIKYFTRIYSWRF